MDKKTARRASLIDEIPGIGKEKAELIGTYLILAVLLGRANLSMKINSSNSHIRGKATPRQSALHWGMSGEKRGEYL